MQNDNNKQIESLCKIRKHVQKIRYRLRCVQDLSI